MREQPLAGRDLRDPLVLAATGFGCGLSPYAPGTVGSALGAVLWWFLFADLDLFVRVGIVAAALAAGVAMVDRVAKRYRLGDEPAIVFDEIVGCWIALLAVPKTLPWVLAGFALFRVADILKPWPVSWADRAIKGGLGIMLDDVIAGALAALALLAALAALADGEWLTPLRHVVVAGG